MNSQKKSWGALGQGLAIISLIAALTGCGGSSDASSTGGTTSASGAGVTGAGPSVSGTPQSTVAVNSRYSFQPTVANTSGMPLTFGIQNKPSWATFGETTGQLSGTPTSSDAGQYPNIVISANDGATTTGLPAFSIQVTPAGSSATGSSSSGSGSSSGSSSGSALSSSSSSSGTSTSASGSMIPSATQLVDSAGHVWTVSAGVVYEGGATAGYSANVAVLLYYGGTIYQENKTCLWYSWTGSTWLPTSNPAPSLTPACGSTVASAPAPTGGFGIQIKGNQFVSAKDGSPVQIVGVVISGLETGYTSRWPQYANASTSFWASLINYQGSGLNTLRLPLNEASWLNYTCYDSGNGSAGKLYAPAAGGGYTPDPDSAYQATVKQAVANATAAGMYVILDLHWGAPNNAAGQPICPVGQPGFADNDHALAFWKSVADTFKGNPAVIFELFNEPYGTNVYNDWLIQTGPGAYTPGSDGNSLLNGGAYSPFDMQDNTNGNAMIKVNESWQVAGMQDMLNTIRGEGATNVVLSAPIGWAGEIETWLATKPTDPIGQLGASWHIYGYNKGPAPPLAVLAAGFPIAITETYGFDSGLDGGSSPNGYTWAASHDIGYTWCCWNDWGMQSSFAVAFADEGPPWFLSTAPDL
jgi:hypothetical protein